MNVGVIGYGYWGPNIVRNFCATPGVNVTRVVDLEEKNLAKAKAFLPALQTSKDVQDVMFDRDLDLVAIVTPVFTHFELAKQALLSGKHVFVEKPFTSNSAQARELIEIAEQKNRRIVVDHTFLFTGAVKKMKQLVDSGELGKLYYYDSTRINLGLLQPDVNVVWDLAPHDFSIVDYLIQKKAKGISAHGADYFKTGIEPIANVTIYYEDGFLGHFNFNWLSPVKVRKTYIGGDKKMLAWDDLEADEKIRIYDKGVDFNNAEGMNKMRVDYRAGDILCPKVPHVEALKAQSEYIFDCIANNRPMINDGQAGLRVVQLLEAAQKSIKSNGQVVEI